MPDEKKREVYQMKKGEELIPCGAKKRRGKIDEDRSKDDLGAKTIRTQTGGTRNDL